MPTYTQSLALALQEPDENDNTWGEVLNDQLAKLEASIAGAERIVLAAANYTLSTAAGKADEASKMVLRLEGQPTQNLSVVVPERTKLYVVRNDTTGEFAVTIRTPQGTGVRVPRGQARMLYCDATEVMDAFSVGDAARVGGMEPGTVVERDVFAREPVEGETEEDSQILDRRAQDARYLQKADAGGMFTTGDIKVSIKQSEPGWVLMNDGTISRANSGGTVRANDDTWPLYELIWNSVANEWAPVTSGGRGASARADFDAGKPLRLPRVLGRALAAAGSGSGLTSRALGEFLGEERHKQLESEMARHTHTYHRYGSGNGAAGAYNSDSGAMVQTDEAGESEPFNVMQPTVFFNLLIKL